MTIIITVMRYLDGIVEVLEKTNRKSKYFDSIAAS